MPTGSPSVKAFGAGDPALTSYAEATFHPEDEILARIRSGAKAAGLPDIAVGKMDGLHLEIIARMVAARRAVEIGTLGGYSGTCLLRGMPADGQLWTLELEVKNAEVARKHFAAAGLAERAHVVVGRALDTLPGVAAQAPFDLVFIDADKDGYPAYLDWAGEHLRPGGVVLGDNAFLWGEVAQPSGNEAPARIAAMQRFNHELGRPGGRFRATMLPTGEGLAVGVKVR
jgi:caffeoyl-CoA O-methyltransferase